MSILSTSGMTPDDYYSKERAWIEKAQNSHAIKYRAEIAVRIYNRSFDLSYDPNEGYEVLFTPGQDIYECMWVCTQLLEILCRPIKTKMNGIQIEWRGS